LKQADAKTAGPSWSASRLGLWSSVLTAVLAAVHFIAGIATSARSGPFAPAADVIHYPYTNVSSFVPMDYTWLYPGFLLAPAFVVLMTSIHYHASDDRKVFSQIGLSFAVIYAAIMTTNYFIQLAMVQPSLLSGETAGLSLFTQYNPHGIFIVLEALGYLMMSVALLFTAVVFAGGRLERAIRWLFVASLLFAVGSLIGFSLLGYDIVAFEVTILTINWTVLIVSGVLLSIVFKRRVVGA
jgi:hypothetical protein